MDHVNILRFPRHGVNCIHLDGTHLEPGPMMGTGVTTVDLSSLQLPFSLGKRRQKHK